MHWQGLGAAGRDQVSASSCARSIHALAVSGEMPSKSRSSLYALRGYPTAVASRRYVSHDEGGPTTLDLRCAPRLGAGP